jgi:CSLREA domain-containing protein
MCAVSMYWAANIQAAGMVVTSAADGAPANDGQCTLREAIINANRDSTAGSSDCAAGSGADTITFASGLDGQTIKLSVIGDTNAGPSALAITSTLTLQGSLGAGIAIARDSAVANLRLFSVGSAGRLTLANLTLSKTYALLAGSPALDTGIGAGIQPPISADSCAARPISAPTRRNPSGPERRVSVHRQWRESHADNHTGRQSVRHGCDHRHRRGWRRQVAG